MRLYPISIAALLLASPAFAGSREDAACLIGKLSAADVAAIVDETMAGRSGGTIARLTGPLHECSAGQDWTSNRSADAAAYATGVMVRSGLHERLVANGVDTAALDRWFARQSLEFRTTAFISMSEPAMQAAFESLVGHEVSAPAMERDGATIGGYLSALVIMERVDRGLGMQ